jgi:tetratricopeptide (TPR) repeat protein
MTRDAWSSSVRLAGLVAVALCLTGRAADRVTIRPEDSSGLFVVTGEIVAYNDEVLKLSSGGPGGLQSYSTASVAAVETFRVPLHLRGIELFEQGRIADAIVQFEGALEQEQRSWLRHEVLAWLVKCHQRSGDLDTAAARFAEIIATESHTRYWNIAPLRWGPQSVSERLQVSARRWVSSSSEALRLLGASLTLGDASGRLTGVAELRKLSRSQDRYVNGQAQALLWESTLDSNVTSVEELLRWQREIERMPESIRGGPWYVLGRVRMHRNEPDEAAAAWLRVLIVNDGDELLSARAGLEAALALRRINREAEVRTILQEVIERFPWTPSAREALAELAKPKAP